MSAQVAALVVLPVLVGWQDPTLFVHPFGPLTKNLPVIAGTVGVLRRCR
ncbi:MAG: DoxX-like family protein [Myxococcota bacterium]